MTMTQPRSEIIAAHRAGTCPSTGTHCHCSNLLGERACILCPSYVPSPVAPEVTLPGEKDSMGAYVAERHPTLAPFVFFPRCADVVGYASLYRRPFLEDMEAVGDLKARIHEEYLLTLSAEQAHPLWAFDEAPVMDQCSNPWCNEPATVKTGAMYEGRFNGYTKATCEDHASEARMSPMFSGTPVYTEAL